MLDRCRTRNGDEQGSGAKIIKAVVCAKAVWLRYGAANIVAGLADFCSLSRNSEQCTACHADYVAEPCHFPAVDDRGHRCRNRRHAGDLRKKDGGRLALAEQALIGNLWRFRLFPAFARLAMGTPCRKGRSMSRLVFIARAIIIAAIIADCAAVGIVAYRWSVLSEAPGLKTWPSLIGLTAFIVFALIRVHDTSKQ